MRLKVLCLHHTRIRVKRSREIDYSLGQSIVFSYFKPLLTSISMKPLALNSYFRVFLARRFWRFPFSPKYRNIRSEIKWNEPVRFGPETTFEGGLHWPVLSFLSVGLPKCACPFDKIVVPTAAHLYAPVCKYNNKKRNGLGRVRATRMYRSTGHMKFPRFQTAILPEWKSPFPSRTWTEFGITRVWRNAVAR